MPEAKLELYLDVLRKIRQGYRMPTRLMQQVSLSRESLMSILDELENQGLTTLKEEGEKRAYSITKKGGSVLDFFDSALKHLPPSRSIDRVSVLSVRDIDTQKKPMEDFLQTYSSFLTVFHSVDAIVFPEFLAESNVRMTLIDGKFVIHEMDDLGVLGLIARNLEFFKEHDVDEKIIDSYMRVLKSVDRSWSGFEEVVEANKEYLKKSDLIYGISGGKYLEHIAVDRSLEGLEGLETCLRLYKRILLPIIDTILADAKLEKTLSKELEISEYGEISIRKARKKFSATRKDWQIPHAIESFNSILSLVYSELFSKPNADREGLFGKLRLVLELNKDRSIALGVYPTLLGTLATKISRETIHQLYSSFLEELVEERTKELLEAQERLFRLAQSQYSNNYESAIHDYAEMINQPDVAEREIQVFLRNNPMLINLNVDRLVAEKSFGGEKFPDFIAILHDGQHIVIEIETPNKRLYTKEGHPSADFSQADQQIQDYLRWANEEKEFLRKRGIPNMRVENTSGLLVIGMTKDLTEEERAKLERKRFECANYRIKTFDEILQENQQILLNMKKWGASDQT